MSSSSSSSVPAVPVAGVQAALQRLGIDNNSNCHDDDSTSIIDTILTSFQQLLTVMASLQYDMSTTTTVIRMNHYSVIPTELQELYDTIHQHTTMIHTTVTKYTLLHQMVVRSSNDSDIRSNDSHGAIVAIMKDLLHSCQILVACTMALYHTNDDDHNNEIRTNHTTNTIGAAPSLCRHTKNAIHQIIHSVVQLLQVFPVQSSCATNSTGTTTSSTTTTAMDPAQRTGVVWEACETIIGVTTATTTTTTKKRMTTTIPLGNRNAIRRDILQYKLECQDTIQEFELLLQQSQEQMNHHHETSSSKNNNNNDDEDENDDSDDDEEEFYTTLHEIKIVTPCVALLKCSRGVLNITLNMIDHIGMSIVVPNSTTTNNSMTDDDNNNRQKYIWIQHLCQEIQFIGIGVTELGATLYPPLHNDDSYTVLVKIEVMKQSNTIQQLLQYMLKEIIDSTTTTSSSSLMIPPATIDLIHSVLTACQTRTEEAMEALHSST